MTIIRTPAEFMKLRETLNNKKIGFVPIGLPFTDKNQEFMAHLVLTLGDLEYVTQNFIIRVV